MAARTLKVILLSHTPVPQEVVAMGARLCYSSSDIGELQEGITGREQAFFLEKLLGSGHLSPIEHASFTFGIEGVSRSLMAQITRHRLASFSVKSQRYVSAASPGSEDRVFDYIIPPRIEALGPQYVQEFARQMKQIQEWYDFWHAKLTAAGETASEDARFVLPNATETKLLVTMNARELRHFFSLRCCNRAQWEIRALAITMLKLVKAIAPVLFKEAGPLCLRGNCPEGRMSCGKSIEVRQFFQNLSVGVQGNNKGH
jgi:thymidylate synthase (FAD)